MKTRQQEIAKVINDIEYSLDKLKDLVKEDSSAEYTSAESSAEYTSAESSAEYKTSWVSSAEYYSSEF